MTHPNYPAFRNLKDKRIILASTSPRRIDLFKRLGLDFQVVASNFEEDYDKRKFATAADYSMATCLKKAQLVQEMTIKDAASPPSLIVSADTIVVKDGVIYEKASNEEQAAQFLRELGGHTIQVITAVAILYHQKDTPVGHYQTVHFSETTDMYMAELSDELIKAYIACGEGLDHSGALAYQGAAFVMVNGIRGCFYNLVGFPVPRFYQEIDRLRDLID